MGEKILGHGVHPRRQKRIHRSPWHYANERIDHSYLWIPYRLSLSSTAAMPARRPSSWKIANQHLLHESIAPLFCFFSFFRSSSLRETGTQHRNYRQEQEQEQTSEAQHHSTKSERNYGRGRDHEGNLCCIQLSPTYNPIKTYRTIADQLHLSGFATFLTIFNRASRGYQHLCGRFSRSTRDFMGKPTSFDLDQPWW